MRAIVLAAGKGRRLEPLGSDLPKVLHTIDGHTLLWHCLKNINFIPPGNTTIVVGYQKDMVINAVPGYQFAEQTEQKGTGHAVLAAADHFANYDGDVLVVYGDMPLFHRQTYQHLISTHTKQNADCTILSGISESPMAYGRIIRKNGIITDIVEEKDCTPTQAKITELNVGVYVFKAHPLFDNLQKLSCDNTQQEYYLTQLPKILMQQGYKITSCTAEDPDEFFGVNTPQDLQTCEQILQKRDAEASLS